MAAMTSFAKSLYSAPHMTSLVAVHALQYLIHSTFVHADIDLESVCVFMCILNLIYLYYYRKSSIKRRVPNKRRALKQ